MNRNIRGRYLQSLGVKQPDIESLLKAEYIDVMELKLIAIKMPLSKNHRSIIWQLFLGVITRLTKTWSLHHAKHEAIFQQLSKSPVFKECSEETPPEKKILRMYDLQYYSDPFTVFDQLCSIMLSPNHVLSLGQSIEKGRSHYHSLFGGIKKMDSITLLEKRQLAFFSVYCKRKKLGSFEKQQEQLIKVIAANVDEPANVYSCFCRIKNRLMRRVLPPELHHWSLFVDILVSDWLPYYAKKLNMPLGDISTNTPFFVECFASLYTNVYITRFLDIIFCHGASMVVLLGIALVEDRVTQNVPLDEPLTHAAEERIIKRSQAMSFRLNQSPTMRASNRPKPKHLNVDTTIKPSVPVFYSP